MNASVLRAIQILEYLATAKRPRSLSAISDDMEMNKSTVYRFLVTLAQEGYVVQDETSGQYRLGPRVAWLAAQFLESIDVRGVARPVLERLGQASGETIHLAILDRDNIMYIDKIDGHQAVRMASFVGSRAPVHSTSVGKVLLAHQPESQWDRYIDEVGLTPCTPNTITDAGVFHEHLQQVRQQGYAIDELENEDGIRCVAAPIRNHVGMVVAAISITGWNVTMTQDTITQLIPLVREGCREVSEKLGYQAS